jgi:hypothetical protein
MPTTAVNRTWTPLAELLSWSDYSTSTASDELKGHGNARPTR